jgi:hypothetical protein
VLLTEKLNPPVVALEAKAPLVGDSPMLPFEFATVVKLPISAEVPVVILPEPLSQKLSVPQGLLVRLAEPEPEVEPLAQEPTLFAPWISPPCTVVVPVVDPEPLPDSSTGEVELIEDEKPSEPVCEPPTPNEAE